jgi:hypothetical protein
MLVPDEAILTEQSQKVVYVLARDRSVTKRVVETGPEILGLRAIRAGIAPTDLVVLDNLSQLKPGTKVAPRRSLIKPRNADAGPAEPPVVPPEASSATATDER